MMVAGVVVMLSMLALGSSAWASTLCEVLGPASCPPRVLQVECAGSAERSIVSLSYALPGSVGLGGDGPLGCGTHVIPQWYGADDVSLTITANMAIRAANGFTWRRCTRSITGADLDAVEVELRCDTSEAGQVILRMFPVP